MLEPVAEAWKPVIARQREVFDAGLKLLTPGRSCAEIIDFAKSVAEKNGMKTQLLVSGRGAGDDGPVIGPKTEAEALKGVAVEKSTLWLLRPKVTSADGKIQFTWGGTVLVTEKGGEVLGKRAHGIMSVA